MDKCHIKVPKIYEKIYDYQALFVLFKSFTSVHLRDGKYSAERTLKSTFSLSLSLSLDLALG